MSAVKIPSFAAIGFFVACLAYFCSRIFPMSRIIEDNNTEFHKSKDLFLAGATEDNKEELLNDRFSKMLLESSKEKKFDFGEPLAALTVFKARGTDYMVEEAMVEEAINTLNKIGKNEEIEKLEFKIKAVKGFLKVLGEELSGEVTSENVAEYTDDLVEKVKDSLESSSEELSTEEKSEEKNEEEKINEELDEELDELNYEEKESELS